MAESACHATQYAAQHHTRQKSLVQTELIDTRGGNYRHLGYLFEKSVFIKTKQQEKPVFEVPKLIAD
jgi:hypothetical protein